MSLSVLDPRTSLRRTGLFSAAVSLAVLAVIVFAAPVSKTHSVVAVGNYHDVAAGKEWRQLPATVGVTWNEADAACPNDGVNACVGSIVRNDVNGHVILNVNVNGWVWATDADVVTLFSHFEPAVTPTNRSVAGLRYFESAQIFLSAFQPTLAFCITYECGAFGAGWTASETASTDDAGLPIIPLPIDGSVSWSTTPVSATGSFGVGPVPSADPIVDPPKGQTWNGRGLWLWRETGTALSPGAYAYDDAGQVASPAGGVAVANVLVNDWIAGQRATANVNVTIEQVLPTDTGITLDPGGSVDVANGTPAGTYTLTYRMCDINNAINNTSICDDATVTVVVNPYVVNAVDDSGWAPPSGGTAIANVLANDTLSGTPATLANVSLSLVSADDGLTLKADGSVYVTAALGTYVLRYGICATITDPDPTHCRQATASVEVKNYVIDAVDDSRSASAKTGGTVVPSVLANDTLNALPATAATVQLSLVSVSPPNPGITLNLSDGKISVAPKTTSGTYTLVYGICEIASPTNCDPAATITLDLIGGSSGSGGGGGGGTTALPTATPVGAGGTTILPTATLVAGSSTILPTATPVAGGSTTILPTATPVGTTALPDIQVSGSASTALPARGAQFSYTFRVRNNGTVGSTEVTLTDLLPAQLPPSAYVTATTSDGNVCAASSPDGGATLSLTCSLGALAAGAEKKVTIVVTAPSAPTTIDNTASATGSNGDTDLRNNSKRISVTVT